MERRRAEEVIKKGPWTAEEDEVLINFVKKNGPRDWSSIRSSGLLPRTGKSCRLRWVNKLRPNLKIGCKFTAEEERVVIELQGRFGNKWATIASYLPGRTDNDVKNFWSTRQKRLARILRSPSRQPTRSPKNKGKALVLDEMPTMQGSKLISPQVNQEPSAQYQSCSSSCIDNTEMIKMVALPDLMNPNLINMNTSLPSLDITDTHTKPSIESHFHFSFITHLPQPKLDIPLSPETVINSMGPGEPDFLDPLIMPRETSELGNVPQLNIGSSLGGMEGPNFDDDSLATPDGFFDDFPVDMLDYFEPVPGSSIP